MSELTEEYNRLNIRLIKFPIKDFDAEDLYKKIEHAVEILKAAVVNGENIFIHCTAGMGRAPTVAALYLCMYENMSVIDSVDYIKRFRPIISPNMDVLIRFFKNFNVKLFS